MKKSILLTFSLFLIPFLFAAPAKNAGETVAEGYAAWSGLTEKNYVCGRHLVPSDLRHKLTEVIFVDAAKFEDQIKDCWKFASGWNPTVAGEGASPETATIPRNRICLVVLVGKLEDPAAVDKFLKKNTVDFSGCVWYVYSNVTSPKVPEHDKLPFYCIFGPEPGDPLASGAADADGLKKSSAIRRDKKYVLENWRPYYGTIEEPKSVKGFAKKLTSGKPLDPLVAECQKGISSKDAEKSKECQILYDALQQACSDMLFDVQSFAGSAPTRAVWEAQILMKQFPKMKKSLKAEVDRLNSIPDMAGLIKMFIQIKKWSAEDFTCKNAAEAKKIEAELLKMKKTCDGIIEKSKVGAAQSAAAWIANEAENLAPTMASKLPVK